MGERMTKYELGFIVNWDGKRLVESELTKTLLKHEYFRAGFTNIFQGHPPETPTEEEVKEIFQSAIDTYQEDELFDRLVDAYLYGFHGASVGFINDKGILFNELSGNKHAEDWVTKIMSVEFSDPDTYRHDVLNQMIKWLNERYPFDIDEMTEENEDKVLDEVIDAFNNLRD